MKINYIFVKQWIAASDVTYKIDDRLKKGKLFNNLKLMIKECILELINV